MGPKEKKKDHTTNDADEDEDADDDGTPATPTDEVDTFIAPSTTGTVYNDTVFFVAIGKKVKYRHDEKSDGVKTCGLYPDCANVLKDKEAVGTIKILSPNQHPNYDKIVRGCWPHFCDSFDGIE